MIRISPVTVRDMTVATSQQPGGDILLGFLLIGEERKLLEILHYVTRGSRRWPRSLSRNARSRDCRSKLVRRCVPRQSRMPCMLRDAQSRGLLSRMRKAAATALIISGEWRLIFTEPTAAVPIMIKMDSFPKSARSVHRSDWNGAEPGRASWTSHTSSCQTGDHRRAG